MRAWMSSSPILSENLRLQDNTFVASRVIRLCLKYVHSFPDDLSLTRLEYVLEMARFFAFFTLLTFIIAVPSTLSAKIPEPGASSSVQAAQAPPITNGSLKPMATTYIVAGSKSTEKRKPQDITSEASEADSEGETAIASSARSSTPTSASTTRTRPHHTSFLTARAEGVQQAEARAGDAQHPQAAKATPGSTHAHYTTFYGESNASQSGGSGQVKAGAGQQGQAANRQMQAAQGSNGAQKGDEAQNECEEEEEEELEDCDEEEEIDDGDDGDDEEEIDSRDDGDNKEEEDAEVNEDK
ncbi:hypothetical protein BJ165DRAFT_665518 [Panaeolus papilionaceus]|nr:hypothetical protein BJ165DRAFT_665518 [Panaeolus papilionaceus]